MPKIVAAVLAAGMVIAWPGHAGVDTLAPARDYRSSFYHITARIPAGWRESEGEKAGPDITFAVDAEGSSGFLRVIIQDVYTTRQWERRPPKSRKQVDRDLRDGGDAQYDVLLEPLADGLVDVVKERTELSGLPAFRISGDQPDGGSLEVYLLYHNGCAVYLVAGTAPGAPPAEADVIRQSLASIVVLRQYEEADHSALSRYLPVVAASGFVTAILAAAAVVAGIVSRRLRRNTLQLPEARPTLMEDAGLSPDLPLATTTQRIGNLILDQVVVLLIIVVLYFVFVFVASFAAATAGLDDPSDDVTGIAYAVLVLLAFLGYYTFLEGGFGRTVGKLITGTKVVNRNGTPLTLWRALVRTCCRFVPLDQFSFFGGDRPVGWHDRWTGTFVVSVRRSHEAGTGDPAETGVARI